MDKLFHIIFTDTQQEPEIKAEPEPEIKAEPEIEIKILKKKYDQNQYNKQFMTKNIITKAQISQRKGRSGRTKNGYCFHLYTKEEEDTAILFPNPEIKKIDNTSQII